MIAILHGIPGDKNAFIYHEVSEIKNRIRITAAINVTGFNPVRSTEKPIKPIKINLTYNFKYYDGEYHYEINNDDV